MLGVVGIFVVGLVIGPILVYADVCRREVVGCMRILLAVARWVFIFWEILVANRQVLHGRAEVTVIVVKRAGRLEGRPAQALLRGPLLLLQHELLREVPFLVHGRGRAREVLLDHVHERLRLSAEG